MISIDYDSVMKFEDLDIGQSFVFKYEIDLINHMIELGKKPELNGTFNMVTGMLKTAENTYQSIPYAVFFDFRKKKGTFPKILSGYTYLGTFVHPLTNEDKNT